MFRAHFVFQGNISFQISFEDKRYFLRLHKPERAVEISRYNYLLKPHSSHFLIRAFVDGHWAGFMRSQNREFIWDHLEKPRINFFFFISFRFRHRQPKKRRGIISFLRIFKRTIFFGRGFSFFCRKKIGLFFESSCNQKPLARNYIFSKFRSHQDLYFPIIKLMRILMVSSKTWRYEKKLTVLAGSFVQWAGIIPIL